MDNGVEGDPTTRFAVRSLQLAVRRWLVRRLVRGFGRSRALCRVTIVGQLKARMASFVAYHSRADADWNQPGEQATLDGRAAAVKEAFAAYRAQFEALPGYLREVLGWRCDFLLPRQLAIALRLHLGIDVAEITHHS